MSTVDQAVDWNKTTFDGSRREQLARWRALSLRERMEALDRLSRQAEGLRSMPRRQGDESAALPAVHERGTAYQAQHFGNAIPLNGCSPTPLANYLKALGVLRLLSARYPGIRGAWRDETFVLHAPLDSAAVERFFLQDYEPTPVMAPWNGGSGFYEKDNQDALSSIADGTASRFHAYRSCLNIAQTTLFGMDRSASPKDGAKQALLRRVRGLLPDAALDWFDAAVLMAGDSPQYPPLLGTGGNDGRLDFTNNFMQRLVELIDPRTGVATTASAAWLRMALFGDAVPGLTKGAIGQFSPGRAGGPNSTSGFDADAIINPWDFVLMIEGALPFAAAAVRRNADDPFGVLSYPFTVRAVGAGAGNLGGADAADSRGELWMPLWHRPAGFVEIRALLTEGRVALGRKPARDSLEFVRAVHTLGGYRGIRSFQRFGLLMRSGKAYLATPLERVNVSDEPSLNLLDELDQRDWLTRFRRFARGENTSNRFLTLRQRLETALFEFAGRHPPPADAQALLVLLGEIQAALANRRKADDAVPPVPRLSERWTQMADDGSPAFRIARALAGLRGVAQVPLPLRSQFFPLHRKFNQWAGTEEDFRVHSGVAGRLPDTLLSLLTRRLWLAERFGMADKPLVSPAGATLDDVAAFLRSDAQDRRIAELLPGLVLCDIPQDVEREAGEGVLPAAFGLLKLCLTPDATLHSLGALRATDTLPVPVGMLAQLAAGNAGNRAVDSAWRRLHASGLQPVIDVHALPLLGAVSPLRAAAALMIPLRYGATGALMRNVLRPRETPLDFV